MRTGSKKVLGVKKRMLLGQIGFHINISVPYSVKLLSQDEGEFHEKT